MAKYQFIGQVTDILPERTYGANNIKEREFRCAEIHKDGTTGKFPNVLPFKVKYDPTTDRINDLDTLQKLNRGDIVMFAWNPKGRLWRDPTKNIERNFIDLKVCSDLKILDLGDIPAAYACMEKNQAYNGGRTLDGNSKSESQTPTPESSATANETVSYDDTEEDMPF